MIYCYGEILWDILPEISLEGGAPMNVCMNLNKLGNKSTLISAVGNDEDGEKLLDYLKSNQLDTNFIQIKSHLPTGKVLVDLSDPTNAIYDIVEPVAYDEIEFDKIPALTLNHHQDILLFGSLALRNPKSRETLLNLTKQPFLKIFDVNLRKPHYKKEIITTLLENANWLKLNDDEFLILSTWFNLVNNEEAAIKEISKVFNIDVICITKGEEGAVLFINDEFYYHKGYSVKVEDTVGAGDAFLAALINSYLLGDGPEAMLNKACRLGAFVASKKGANPNYTFNDMLNGKD